MIDLPRTRTLGPPEESIEVSQIPRQSSARSTQPICDNLNARTFRSPSIGTLDAHV